MEVGQVGVVDGKAPIIVKRRDLNDEKTESAGTFCSVVTAWFSFSVFNVSVSSFDLLSFHITCGAVLSTFTLTFLCPMKIHKTSWTTSKCISLCE